MKVKNKTNRRLFGVFYKNRNGFAGPVTGYVGPKSTFDKDDLNILQQTYKKTMYLREVKMV